MLLLLLLLVVIVHHELLRSLNDLKDGEGALRVGLPAVAHVLAKVPRAQVLVEPLRRAQSSVQPVKKGGESVSNCRSNSDGSSILLLSSLN